MANPSLLLLSLGTVVALGLGAAVFNIKAASAQNVAPRAPLPASAHKATVPLPTGEALFEKRCSGCHELDEHDRGPALRDVYGRMAGHKAGFRYSQALSARYFNWDEANLDIWLQGPGRMVPGVAMRRHIPAANERAAIIAYLKGLSITQSNQVPNP